MRDVTCVTYLFKLVHEWNKAFYNGFIIMYVLVKGQSCRNATNMSNKNAKHCSTFKEINVS